MRFWAPKKHPVIALDIDGVLLPYHATSGREVYSIFNSGLVPPQVNQAVEELKQSVLPIKWFTSWDEEVAEEAFGWLGMRVQGSIEMAGPSTSSKIEQKLAGMHEFLKTTHELTSSS